MPYKIYTDKNEDFECEVAAKNASLKGSIARLVIESDDGPTLVFKGHLNGEKCIIPIKRLKGLLDENARGKMHLEVIVEDIYFKPWESDFIVEEHTSVKVKVNESKQSSSRPIIKVKVQQQKTLEKPIIKENKRINIYAPLRDISTICEHFGIKSGNLQKRKSDFIQILREYFKINPEYNKHKASILTSIPNFLM